MAIPFKSPVPRHRYIINKEIAALDAHFVARQVPVSSDNRLLLASWNVANLGAQGRTDGALRLIAHIMKRFDLIAVQEVNEEFRTFASIVKRMGAEFDFIMCDTAGNNERLAYVFRKAKVRPLQMFGELALRDREFPKRNVKVRYRENRVDKVETLKDVRFRPFDRNPFIGSFACGDISFTLVNVHLYFGKDQNSRLLKDRQKYARRVLEIFALAKWADRRRNRSATYDKDIILLGDMNVPAMEGDDATYKALIKFGFQPVDYTTKTGGSNLGNNKTYDQMAFAPGSIKHRIKQRGVFDFDKAVFSPLWVKLRKTLTPKKTVSKFNSHVKHHISDHRPLWVELDITK